MLKNCYKQACTATKFIDRKIITLVANQLQSLMEESAISVNPGTEQFFTKKAHDDFEQKIIRPVHCYVFSDGITG